MLGPLSSLFSLSGPPQGTLAYSDAQPNPSTTPNPGEDPASGVAPIRPLTPVGGATGADASNPNVLATLPSAQKAAQKQSIFSGVGGGGMGDALAAGVDAAKGHSAWGAFAAGFAHGMKATSDYSDKQAVLANQSQKSQLDALKMLFDVQQKGDSSAETARHNRVTEGNTAKSQAALQKYYETLGNAKTDATLSPNDISLGLQRAHANSGYNPGDPDFELKLNDQQKEDARQRFAAEHKSIFGAPAPDDLLGRPYINKDGTPNKNADTRTQWQKLAPGIFGGLPDPTAPQPSPTPGAVSPPAPAAPQGSATPAPPAAAAPQYKAGQTIINRATGERMQFDGKQFVPLPKGAAPTAAAPPNGAPDDSED